MNAPGNAAQLQEALDAEGIDARAEGRGSLAVLIPSATSPSVPPSLRRWLVQAAQSAGFTHVALEVAPQSRSVDAALPRDSTS